MSEASGVAAADCTLTFPAGALSPIRRAYRRRRICKSKFLVHFKIDKSLLDGIELKKKKSFICAQLEPARINTEEMLHSFNAQMLLICLK